MSTTAHTATAHGIAHGHFPVGTILAIALAAGIGFAIGQLPSGGIAVTGDPSASMPSYGEWHGNVASSSSLRQ